MKFLFNEQSAIEKMIKMKVVDNDNIYTTIMDLARYNHFVNGFNQDKNYQNILVYLQNYGQNINEECVYQIIDECVKKAKKYQLKTIDEVRITKSELDFIHGLNDIKQEKVTFVLLAAAKYYDAVRGVQNYTAYMSNSDICKLAKITIPVKDRNIFMQFAYDKNVLSVHNAAASIRKQVLFVSEDSNDEVVLQLKESDYKDLAYTYLAYKTPHNFRRCVTCGKWIRRNAKDSRQCKECADMGSKEVNGVQEVQCKDCGRSVYVSLLNSKTYRCEECQKKADYDPMKTKIAVCVDCGKEFEVNSKNNKSCRCKDCQREFIRQYDRRRKSNIKLK